MIFWMVTSEGLTRIKDMPELEWLSFFIVSAVSMSTVVTTLIYVSVRFLAYGWQRSALMPSKVAQIDEKESKGENPCRFVIAELFD